MIEMRSVLPAMVDLVFVLDEGGRFIFFNGPGVAVLVHAPPEEILGKRYDEVLPPHVSKLLADGLARSRGGGSVTFEYELDAPSGEGRF